MICPWCFHYGVEDDEYLFDDEMYCGICAQQMPETQETWQAAFRGMDSTMISYVEQELNRIAVSKSGLRAELLEEMGRGIDALAIRRGSGQQTSTAAEEAEYVRWVQFACTYFAPRLR
jgi:hypothetical protein